MRLPDAEIQVPVRAYHPCEVCALNAQFDIVLALEIVEHVADVDLFLTSCGRLVKPGGLLLYATCSLLDEENAEVVESFLAAHAQFELRPANAALAQQRIALDTGEYLRLAPHLHGSDGFFAALIAKKA